jgi:hypothetical protein
VAASLQWLQVFSGCESSVAASLQWQRVFSECVFSGWEFSASASSVVSLQWKPSSLGASLQWERVFSGSELDLSLSLDFRCFRCRSVKAAVKASGIKAAVKVRGSCPGVRLLSRGEAAVEVSRPLS